MTISNRRILLLALALLTILSCSLPFEVAGTLVNDESSLTPDPTIQQAVTAAPSDPPEYLSHLEPMTLITPTSGNGIRPLLEWTPVPEAHRYGVYLYAPGGRLYWSWQGQETSVPVGGRPQLHEDASGPSVADGMSWMVIAYDQNNEPLASAGPREIAP